MDLITNQTVEDPVSKSMLTQSALISSYRVAEFVTLARNGSPVCWPLAPELENGRLSFSTGYIYPTKARNAQRNPRVAALFSDPTASGRSGDDPQVLVQGLAEVFEQDLQRNTERYVDQAGWPAVMRVQATVKRDHIEIGSELEPSEGAPACLTYHRLIGNYLANDAFLVRGHFDAAGRLLAEKVVGFGGTQDDRGLGSVKMIRMLLGFRKQLSLQLEKEARPFPVVRPTQRSIR